MLLATLANVMPVRSLQVAELYIVDNILGEDGLVPDQDKVRLIEAKFEADESLGLGVVQFSSEAFRWPSRPSSVPADSRFIPTTEQWGADAMETSSSPPRPCSVPGTCC